ncbi:MAG: phosphoribosylformylglycinamidine synthase subunit PurL [Candidatus Omnitrophica bacterium]|nr:phosphoribosylformylglycinamidine synthase subunit PurL [Candidatus Omnitrophota bacterium]
MSSTRITEAVKVTPALLKKLNVKPEEYERIVKIMGRAPTMTELGIFSVQWAEHCSYASSKVYLKTFPTRGKGVLVRAGEENAGVIDIGNGLGVAFKIESHNHPSAVEPHAGAATGVGGILRDIFTMGARPIALFDSLRFGPLNGTGRTRFLFEGVVRGIADYGNCIGVPTVGGEIYFDETYRENPLVNVMCVGIVPAGRIAKARAKGVGNTVMYVGSSTGRDGLGGASFASREITDGSEADRPAVQIGDPFAEKCLLEATLEALTSPDVVAIQDMGAAGLTCSTCETASRGRCGIEIDVAKVPRREDGMTPFEVMLSESQERMLLIVKRGREDRIKRHFAKWGLNAVSIGHITNDGLMRVKDRGEVVAEVPVGALTHEAPVYHRPTRRPRYLSKVQRLSLRAVSQPKDFGQTLVQLLSSPTIASKAHVFEQYDHMVQTNTVTLPGRADAAVLHVKGTDHLLAATTDANATYCFLDPYQGGKLAVAEAARNLVCVGAKPLAVTDCLNFGNPEDPEIMWQFKECVRGISEACRAFAAPVTGGNVSFYNESPRGAIDPTPVIGMIGLIEGEKPLTAGFKDEGDAILLFGQTKEEMGGSEYLKVIHKRKQGKPPQCDLRHERRLGQLMLELFHRGLLKSAHDCSEGGLAVTLAECCIMDEERLIGAAIELSSDRAIKHLRSDALLFGESAGRIIVSCERYHQELIEALAKRFHVPMVALGRVGGGRLLIPSWIGLAVDELSHAWREGLAHGVRP